VTDPLPWHPDRAPDAGVWLALDDEARRAAITAGHRAHPSPALHPGGEGPRHAHLHALVETWIASGEPPAVGRAVTRLTSAGLRRHAALHAVMDRIAAALVRALQTGGLDRAALARELDDLDASAVVARALTAAHGPVDHPADDPDDDPDDDPSDDPA
jgi:hypothetical protein